MFVPKGGTKGKFPVFLCCEQGQTTANRREMANLRGWDGLHGGRECANKCWEEKLPILQVCRKLALGKEVGKKCLWLDLWTIGLKIKRMLPIKKQRKGKKKKANPEMLMWCLCVEPGVQQSCVLAALSHLSSMKLGNYFQLPGPAVVSVKWNINNSHLRSIFSDKQNRLLRKRVPHRIK